MPDPALAQPRILTSPTPNALFVTWGLRGGAPRLDALRRLADVFDPSRAVLGLGLPLGVTVPGLRGFTPVTGRGVSAPSTQGAVWTAIYDGDPGEQLHEARRLGAALGPDFVADEVVTAYQHREGRDLSGYLDGTANPEGAAAAEVALVEGPPGLAGGSFVSTQRWIHDLDAAERMTQAERDAMVGRRIADNEEIDDAPESAHVKRTAQEDVGFLLRRSMPWGTLDVHGLVVVAYAHDPDVFLRHLRRMAGAEDGVMDALFRFTRPVSGGLYWCPPMREGKVDLSAVG